MYSVYQPWDPLKVCVVGRSYPPEFYEYITNPRLRELFQQIARETEEDFQNIINTLEKFNVKVIRPNVPNIQFDQYLTKRKRIPSPVSMNPRDQMIMIGEQFFVFPYNNVSNKTTGQSIKSTNWTTELYNHLKGPSWPQEFVEYNELPEWIRDECVTQLNFTYDEGEDLEELAQKTAEFAWWSPILNEVQSAGNPIIENQYNEILNRIPANGITRIGRDLYFGVDYETAKQDQIKELADVFFKDYRCHFVTTGGHIDGCFTPVKPGLIVSINEIQTYNETFPGWEVVYLPNESWSKVQSFIDLKQKNQGRWWIKDHEHDEELIEFVETWLQDWTGYVEESVFDVNILVIDQENIIVSSYNKQAFEAFARHGVTAHICTMRHRYFWDGGVHCVTLDLDRDGSLQDFFPNR